VTTTRTRLPFFDLTSIFCLAAMVNMTPWRKEQPPAPTANTASVMPAGEQDAAPRRKWNLGILSDAQTDEVPGRQHSDASCPDKTWS
jgi:hypothetical protein